MYMMYMVRKQLYIEKHHDQALKKRAKALGVSEADVVRQALDAMFASDGKAIVVPGHNQALHELLERAAEFAARPSHGQKTARFRREELYEERENRWPRS